jgi:hypothetical protein
MKYSYSDITRLASATPRHEPSFQLPDGKVILVRHPNAAEVNSIHTLTRTEIATSTVPLAVIKTVYKHNKDTLWGIYIAENDTPEALRGATMIGYYSFLHLTAKGMSALERGDLNAADPDLSLLAPNGTRPTAIYIWGVVAKRVTRIATPLIARALGRDLYGGLPLYTTAGTLGGLKAIKSFGFAGTTEETPALGQLFRMDPPTAAPAHVAVA